jgi:UDPglucose 6-dehydrogenase
MVLIGASDDVSSDYVKNLYASMVESAPRYGVMSLVNAEITKLSLNCYVTMKISFANELTALCGKIPGANVDDVTGAIGADSRVGPKYLRGGLGFGGPCFPRDNIAFQECAKEFGYDAKLGPQVVAINRQVVASLAKIVTDKIPRGFRIAILGLSYKPDTHIVEESQSIMLAQALVDKGYKVAVHDPAALECARKILGDAVSYHGNAGDAVKNSSCVVLMTPWKEYEGLDLQNKLESPAVIIDVWRTFAKNPPANAVYIAMGKG